MSIDLNWEALTSGPDGDALAERIRAFIHDKFQTVPLPRFIKSVTVHGFDFGTVPPELALKDISDPLPDFYEPQSPDDGDDEDDETDGDDEAPNQDERPHVGDDDDHHHHHHHHQRQQHRDKHRHKSNDQRPRSGGRVRPPNINMGSGNAYFSGHHHLHHDLASPFMGTSTPGLLGGPALGYLHGHLGTGTQTPLAAVAGAHLGNSWLGNGFDNASAAAATEAAAVSADTARSRVAPSHGRKFSQGSISVDNSSSHFGSPPRPQQSAASAAVAAAAASSPSRRGLNEKSSVSTLAPTITSNSRPPTRDSRASSSSSAAAALLDPDYGRNVAAGHDGDGADKTAPAANVPHDPAGQPSPGRRREPRAEDVQAVFRIRYTGDVRLNLTAEILLDYPMPSFVGIPLKLNITGMSFDGVGVLAHIRKRVHFCFLSPEDAVTAVGGQNEEHDNNDNDGDGGDYDGGPGGPAASSSENGGGSNGGGGGGKPRSSTRFGGLLQEIKVESEIGGREGGKQSLKNVGKVEKFVLEQVRRIFDEEFVYPSFWTFLV